MASLWVARRQSGSSERIEGIPHDQPICHDGRLLQIVRGLSDDIPSIDYCVYECGQVACKLKPRVAHGPVPDSTHRTHWSTLPRIRDQSWIGQLPGTVLVQSSFL